MDSSTPDRFRELIGKAKKGDTEAFGTLYEAWYTPVYRFILLRVKSPETAEDLVQDVFMKVFAHLDRFELRAAHPLGFLFTTARNTVIDYHKKKKPDRLDEEVANAIPDTDMKDPQTEASLSFDVGNLGEALRSLTREQQDIITLRLIEERSVKETAEITGKSEEAVRQMQVRALRALREYFKENNLYE